MSRDSSSASTPNKDRDGVHLKEIGRDFVNFIKRKKKKKLQPHGPFSPIPSSETQREDPSDPVSVQIQHLPHTPPTHSESTQHSADARSTIHTHSSAEVTSTGATSGDTMDHDNSAEDQLKRKSAMEERRAHYRSLGIHVVADEDDHTDLEESHTPFRVDRRFIDRLQWKDGIAPVEILKPRKPRFVKRKEEVRPRSEMSIMKDAIPLEEVKKPVDSKEGLKEVVPLGLSRKRSKKKDDAKDEFKEAMSMVERRQGSAEKGPIEDKTPRKKSKEEKKKEEQKDPIAVEDSKKGKEPKIFEMKDAIPLEEKKEKKKEKEEGCHPEISHGKKKSKKRGSGEEEAIEDNSDQEKRRRKKGEGVNDAIEDRSDGRKRHSREEEKKRDDKGKEEKKEERKKEDKKETDEGKKKDAKGGGGEEEKKERGKEKRRDWKKGEEDGDIKGERETREARRKEEEKIGEKEGLKSDDKVTVVPYEEWPVPALVDTIDGYTGYRVLSSGYKAAYFGYVCIHVSCSFVAHVFNFDFNRSVPPLITKKLTQSSQAKSGKRDEGTSPSSSTTRSTPRSKHSATKRIVIQTPVKYSTPSDPSNDSVEVAMCH